MSIINRLSSSIGRKDEVPNQELAQEICKNRDTAAIEELLSNLSGTNKAIQSDCIKVLYEIGYVQPELISQYVSDFLSLLNSKNNRMVWGAMITLSTIAQLKPDEIFKDIDLVLKTIEHGSVITVDNGISVLAVVSSTDGSYEEKIVPFLLEHLSTCRPKEVAQHAERSLIAVNANNKKQFEEVILERLGDLTDSQIKRVNKMIKEINER